MTNKLNGNEFSRLDTHAETLGLTATEKVTAQILLAVQIMVRDARVNDHWLNWDEEAIAVFAQREANKVCV